MTLKTGIMRLKIQLCITEINYILKYFKIENLNLKLHILIILSVLQFTVLSVFLTKKETSLKKHAKSYWYQTFPSSFYVCLDVKWNWIVGKKKTCCCVQASISTDMKVSSKEKNCSLNNPYFLSGKIQLTQLKSAAEEHSLTQTHSSDSYMVHIYTFRSLVIFMHVLEYFT